MNFDLLEKVVRQTLRGETPSKNLALTPAEHRSVKSLSWQIAANVRADSNGGLTIPKPTQGWL